MIFWGEPQLGFKLNVKDNLTVCAGFCNTDFAKITGAHTILILLRCVMLRETGRRCFARSVKTEAVSGFGLRRAALQAMQGVDAPQPLRRFVDNDAQVRANSHHRNGFVWYSDQK